MHMMRGMVQELKDLIDYHADLRDKAIEQGNTAQAEEHEDNRKWCEAKHKEWVTATQKPQQETPNIVPPQTVSKNDDVVDKCEEYDELEENIDIIHTDGDWEDSDHLYSLFVEGDDFDAWFAWVPKPANIELDDWAENHYGEDERPEQEDLLEQYYMTKYEGDIWHRVTVFQITGKSGRSIFLASQTGEYGMDITTTAHPSMASLEKWYSDRGWYDRIY
jgi:hypothetical protein